MVAAGKEVDRKLGASPSFTSDFSQMGTGRSSMVFQGAGPNILDQEKAMIDKVFGIVDKDNSGSIDADEIKDMFNLFGIETSFLDTAISRIMSNVDKDQDEMISPTEFYNLLSQKFQKGDARKDIDDVFHRINRSKSKEIDVDELHAIAQQLGEVVEKKEIRDMIRTFNTMHEESASQDKKGPSQTKKTEEKREGKSDDKSVSSEAETVTLNMDTWYFIMQHEL